ncbi:site-specific DNA-methyltransferase, partial [Acinetobacter baumannii]|uniref:site-specific DNA-methyltransferase n=5 Tax=Moraxellaceae TaxID=468 RepID=UPI000352F4C0
ALLPRYAGKVKCIYIDPPYNTGNEKWAYNDNVNSPEIRKWLGEAVGKEGETLDRHDRWLCMMYPRLLLLRKLLSDDGIIFISIGDDELGHLILMMDEIFGKNNQIANFVWKSRAKPSNTGEAKLKPQNDAEYIVAYRKKNKPKFNLINSGVARSYPHTDIDGNYRLQTILKSNRGENKRETMQFSLAGYTPPPTKRWQAGFDTVSELYNRNRITFQTGEPMLKYYEHEEAEEFKPFYCFVGTSNSGTAESGKKVLNNILGLEHGFDTVKPTSIIEYLLERVLGKEDIVLDSFAGSGTTAHAVLNLNKKDQGNRKFILIEMDEQIAKSVTMARIKKVINGYQYKGKSKDILFSQMLNFKSLLKANEILENVESIKELNKENYSSIKVEMNENYLEVIGETTIVNHTEGIDGNFQFFKLSQEPLFDASGHIRADVSFSQLAEFVWFSETGTGYTGKADSPLLGVFEGRAIYLLYNGILKDITDEGGNILTKQVFDVLPKFDGAKVIYAAANRLGIKAKRKNIVFKQTPYALEV